MTGVLAGCGIGVVQGALAPHNGNEDTQNCRQAPVFAPILESVHFAGVLLEHVSAFTKVKPVFHNQTAVNLASEFFLIQRVQRTYLYGRRDRA